MTGMELFKKIVAQLEEQGIRPNDGEIINEMIRIKSLDSYANQEKQRTIKGE